MALRYQARKMGMKVKTRIVEMISCAPAMSTDLGLLLNTGSRRVRIPVSKPMKPQNSTKAMGGKRMLRSMASRWPGRMSSVIGTVNNKEHSRTIRVAQRAVVTVFWASFKALTSLAGVFAGDAHSADMGVVYPG